MNAVVITQVFGAQAEVRVKKAFKTNGHIGERSFKKGERGLLAEKVKTCIVSGKIEVGHLSTFPTHTFMSRRAYWKSFLNIPASCAKPRLGLLEKAILFGAFVFCNLAIDTVLIIEYTSNHMVNNLEITIKKRSG